MKMKQTITQAIAMLMMFMNIAFAGNPLEVRIESVRQTAPNSLEFDIIAVNTGDEDITYSVGQYFLQYDPNLLNGGEGKYDLIRSELPDSFRPRSSKTEGGILKLAANRISTDKDRLPVISKGTKSFLIARMRLQTNAGAFANVAPEIRLTNSDSKFTTKIGIFSNNATTIIPFSLPEEEETDVSLAPQSVAGSLPAEYALSQNYPNPFNPATVIRFSLPKESEISLRVYDISGRMVRELVEGRYSAGSYSVTFSGHDLASGMYFYRFESAGYTSTMKMVLLK